MNEADIDPKLLELRAGEIGVGTGVGAERGKILLCLPEPKKWLAMEPAQAVAIAKDMIDKVVKLGMNVEILVPKKPISQSRRNLIVNRIDLVMRSLQEKKRPSRYIAEELVDIVLRDSGA